MRVASAGLEPDIGPAGSMASVAVQGLGPVPGVGAQSSLFPQVLGAELLGSER